METDRLHQSYRYCEWIAYHHYENFPVASLILPKEKRSHVAAVYAFARSADDFADEIRYQADSLELLEAWRAALWACQNGGGVKLVSHPIFIALAHSITTCGLPVQLLDDLLTAFRMDVTKRRYENWQELLDYCRFSANPVGRLVLTIFGYQDPELHLLSDHICTGLQLANHWQDLRIDMEKDLLYIPRDLQRRFGVDEEEFRGAMQGRMSDRFRALMAELVDRADALFKAGAALPGKVEGPLRLELKLTLLGGRAVLERIRQVDYDVFRQRPVLSPLAKLKLLGLGLVS
ncbi:MAG: squalene synthase HpnC [Candidatus Omnitrophica bacterium]|nr:squalene synthase HpnC [Candidatus Omnitrophota bacterium]